MVSEACSNRTGQLQVKIVTVQFESQRGAQVKRRRSDWNRVKPKLCSVETDAERAGTL